MGGNIRKVAVIGSGVMGKGIAAHLANCGIPSLLLDLKRETAEEAVASLPKTNPALLYTNSDARLITPGAIDDNMAKIAECDWVVEVIIEKLAPKQELYAKLEKQLKPNQIISSNTSGISWHILTEGRSDKFKERFCITHFFNPVRYLKLVELVGGAGTDPQVLKTMEHLLADVLGKGVVHAKDTPNFIANRIGVHGVMVALHAVEKHGWKFEFIDKVLGPATGRAKSAVFRTSDLVGLDTLGHVAANTFELCPDDEARAVYKMPSFVEKMLEQKKLGSKSGEGFYKKNRNADGSSEIMVLDPDTMSYRSQEKLKTPSLGAAKDIEDLNERLRTVVFADDEAGKIAWELISQSLVYSANRVPEIAENIYSIDSAMKWGFGWEIGPFESWDALGVKKVADRLQKEGRAVPVLVKQLLESGKDSFYGKTDGKKLYYDVKSKSLEKIPVKPGVVFLSALKEQNKIVEQNDGATLIDLGDGVFNVEFQTKMNALDSDIISMMHKGLDRAEKEGVGLVIGNEGKNFCVGANLMLIYLEAQQKNWERISAIVQEFQGVCQRMRFSPKPVVAAPFQMVLGGGCEVVLGASHVRAAAETYIGLVELGVGLIPAGAGCKNMLLHMEERLLTQHNPTDQIWMSPKDGGPFPKVRMVFEVIGYAKVATSGKDAKKVGYLRKSDRIAIDQDTLLSLAKADVLELASAGYTPPIERKDISLPGEGGCYALKNAIHQAKLQGLVTDYDQVLGEKLAYVLSGGNKPNAHLASEQDILDLEREAFLSLCGDERSHARIQSMLMTGKPLRN